MVNVFLLLPRLIGQSLGQTQSRQFRNSARQNALLRRIVDRIRNSLELKVVLQAAVEEVATLLELDRCSFFWYFEDTRRIQVVCEYQRVGGEVNAAHKPPKNMGYYPLEIFGTVSAAIAKGELVISEGVPAHLSGWQSLKSLFSAKGGNHQPAPTVLGATANLLIPIRPAEGSVGFLACLADRPRRWSTDEVDFMQLIAQQLEIAIGQAQMYEKTQSQAQRERLVNQITAQTRQSFELEKILTGAIAQLMVALESDRCIVHLVEDPTAESTAAATQDRVTKQLLNNHKQLHEVCRPPFLPSVEGFDLNGPITQWVIQNRQQVSIGDVSQDQRIGADNPEYERAQIKSSLVLPVQTKDTLFAILYLNQCSHARYWSRNDRRLAQAVADQLAISIQQAHLYAQMQQQAVMSACQAENLALTLDKLRLTQAQLIQSEKISSLGRMVAGVAHEINNPINFIYGNVPYIESYLKDLVRLLKAYQGQVAQPNAELQGILDEIDLEFLLRDLPQILNSMQAGADRIRQIVLTLRNFSRLDEASLKLVDVHEGIESTLSILKPQLDGIEVIRQYGELPLVECFPSHLNQAFINIIMNAVEALKQCKDEAKTIAICSELIPPTESNLAMVRIVIADNGIGIAHEIQSKIFDPFFTTKDVGEGTGLGLTMSYQTVVGQHKGRLKFYSEPSLGAEFLIELPVKHAGAGVADISL